MGLILNLKKFLIKPKKCDLPGVVSQEDHEIALRAFPDPRLVLGPLY